MTDKITVSKSSLDTLEAAIADWHRIADERAAEIVRLSGMHEEILAELKALAGPTEQLARDAARYRWLREQHWSNGPMCVVMNPKAAVKLMHYCPSQELLDEEIDRLMRRPAT